MYGPRCLIVSGVPDVSVRTRWGVGAHEHGDLVVESRWGGLFGTPHRAVREKLVVQCPRFLRQAVALAVAAADKVFE